MPEEQFGGKSEQKAAPKRAVPEKQECYIVTERVDRAVPVRHATVIFRRDQVLSDPHLIGLAKEHHIRIKVLEED